MNAKEFYEHVVKMRYAQRRWFKYHEKEWLQESQRLEKICDAEIERVTKLTNEPELKL